MIHSTNQELAIFTLGQLEKLGVKTLCICPGARNSPWLSELEKSSQFEKLYFFDERSAGFFALSRARAQLAPVAVLTTSGTAVGELLPAMMEAFYSGAPLWVLSADRPQRFRTTGAPQSCEQEGIFGVYAKWCVELDRSSSLKNVKNEFSAPLEREKQNLWRKRTQNTSTLRNSKYPENGEEPSRHCRRTHDG
jgi:2-succinyl-5-enolpyruvyl-6-hydroxy-3-cyclohexene-1-carboxylate synthase